MTIPTNPSVIFTIGPSTLDEKVLTGILSLPVSYVRFNMSHGSHDEHRDRLKMVRKVAKTLSKEIKVFVDLCGPKIRVHKMKDVAMNIAEGSTVIIVNDSASVYEKESAFAISFSDLYLYVKKDTTIALDDGKILLRVASIDGKDIICEVVQGGLLLNEKGVNIIDTNIPVSPFTAKDEKDALFAIEQNVDAIALSFVKKKEDILSLRAFLKEHTENVIPIIAKIETRQALHDMEGIFEVTDMIMVARGDLGIEIPVQRIPIVQKELVFLAKSKGIPAIVATEMLKSMTKNSFPTRAEITDCINALVDGASYIMLSDETTTGEYPVEAVTVMSSVIDEFVEHKKQYHFFEK